MDDWTILDTSVGSSTKQTGPLHATLVPKVDVAVLGAGADLLCLFDLLQAQQTAALEWDDSGDGFLILTAARPEELQKEMKSDADKWKQFMKKLRTEESELMRIVTVKYFDTPEHLSSTLALLQQSLVEYDSSTSKVRRRPAALHLPRKPRMVILHAPSEWLAAGIAMERIATALCHCEVLRSVSSADHLLLFDACEVPDPRREIVEALAQRHFDRIVTRM